MGLRIQNNVEAFNAHRNLTTVSNNAAKAMEKLSSGYRINRAADDAAGLAISEKMRSQIGGLAQAQRNAQDAISLVQTSEGALTEVHSMLQRVRDLRVQYDSGTLAASDKTAIESEVKALATEIGDITNKTQFNGTKLLSTTTNFSFQVGADTGDTLSMSAITFSAAIGAGGTGGLSEILAFSLGASAFSTNLSLSGLDAAIANVSSKRADFGAVQNRLEHRLNNLGIYQENLVASESRIRDVDMAAEMVNFTKLQILQQAGTSMLAQANQASQGVLSLLQH